MPLKQKFIFQSANSPFGCSLLALIDAGSICRDSSTSLRKHVRLPKNYLCTQFKVSGVAARNIAGVSLCPPPWDNIGSKTKTDPEQ